MSNKELFIKSSTEDLYHNADISSDAVTFVSESENECIFARDTKYQAVPSGGTKDQYLVKVDDKVKWANDYHDESSTACDVLLYDRELDKLWVSKHPFDVDPERYVPVGIEIIPERHGVLKTGDGKRNVSGFISIVPMDCDTPVTGGNTEKTMYWGYYSTLSSSNIDISGYSDGLGRYDSTQDGLTNYNGNPIATNTTSNNAGSLNTSTTTFCYLPTQVDIKGKAVYKSNTRPVPSPYIGVNLAGVEDFKLGGHNPAYSTKSLDNGSNLNALADFAGIVNTKIITDSATAEDWKYVNSIGQTSENLQVSWSIQQGSYITENSEINAFDNKKFTIVNRNGTQTVRCTFKGKAGDAIVFTCSHSKATSYYIIIGELDTVVTNSNKKYSTSDGLIHNYMFEIPDDNEHYIELGVYRSGSTNTTSYVGEIFINKLPVFVDNGAFESITNSSSIKGIYPAACCCAKYRTEGTKAFIDCTNEELYEGTGFWYLPAIGELGYLPSVRADLNDLINQIKSFYGIGSPLYTGSSSVDFHSSTEGGGRYNWVVDCTDGGIAGDTKNTQKRVRAFLRGKYDRLN